MATIDTVVIGGGHAGLAVSRLLTRFGREHIVLERGRLAESWRSERWDSLHLLTPNWMTRLPGWAYDGPEEDGFMPAGELVRHLERYAVSFDAPVLTGTTVDELTSSATHYRVATDRGTWRTENVVIATGPTGRPFIPEPVQRLSPELHVTTASQYRNPDRLPSGGVLVVGASASGVQIADELAEAGRDVVLSAGRHTRMPRRYRGMDIFWWLERTGRTSRTIDELDPVQARREPSLQLVGRSAPGPDLDLAVLQRRGVRLTGRLRDADGPRVAFHDDLGETVARAEDQLAGFLDAIDRHVENSRLGSEVWPGKRPRPLAVQSGPTTLDLRAEGITTVLLATGYRPHHPWLHLPITSPEGAIRQHRGVTEAPGVYVVGQRFQHRRDSAMIDGARHDAAAVVAHLTRRAARGLRPPRPATADRIGG